MSDITINLNNSDTFSTTVNVINLIDVLKSQMDDDETELVILNEDMLGDDLSLILETLTLYLSEKSKVTILPQPMPNDKSFNEIVQQIWEKHIVEAINLREGDERIKYAIKMGTLCDYLCCTLLKNFFCAYVGSWMKRSDNEVVQSFFREAGMIVEG